MAGLKEKWSKADEFTALIHQMELKKIKENRQRIVLQFTELVEQEIALQNNSGVYKSEKQIYGAIKFFKEEISIMDKKFQKEIRKNDCCARVCKTIENKTVLYTITYRKNGYKIIVSAPDLKDCKKQFIEKTFVQDIKIKSLIHIRIRLYFLLLR